MIKLRKKCDEEAVPHIVKQEQEKELYPILRKFVYTADTLLSRNRKYEFKEELLDLYFEISAFLRITEYYDERYVTYIEKERNDIRLKLFCLDPSFILQNIIDRSRAAIFFSATLMPLDYFVRMLGGSSSDIKLSIPSPFPSENLCVVLADNVGTRYTQREYTYDYETRSIRLIAVFVTLINNDFSLSVHDKVEWVDAESIGKYEFAPADVSIAKRLKEECFI
jgi:Rad3-related DNA helicase